MDFKKKFMALCMAAVMTASTVAVSAAPATGAPDEQLNGKNLWITEIYQNDANRSSVYGNDSDQMEFVEITNTMDRDVNFNEEYTLNYEYASGDGYTMKQLTVRTPDGSSDVIIPAGETVLFWSRRDDIAPNRCATEEEFRTEMRVDSDVKVFVVSGQNGFAENDRGFAIKTSSGDTVCHFRYNSEATDTHTADGLSVQLQIPDFGTEMLVYQAKKPTTAGKVFAKQLNGQRDTVIPSEDPSGVFITEIRPNDSNRDAQFGSASNDMMECLELTNTTDRDINLSEEYVLYYRLKETRTVELPLMTIADRNDPNTELITGDCIIPANSTAVIWCFRRSQLEGSYDRFPTEEEFRAAYSLPEDVPVYVFTAQNGLNNTLRGFELYHKDSSGALTLESSYFWDGTSDVKDNRSVDLRVNPEGPQMEVYRACSTTNMGTVSEAQITYAEDDGSSPELVQLEEVDSVNQGEFVRIPFSFAGTSTMPVNAISLYYKTSEMDSFKCDRTTSFAIYNKWYAFIPSADILNADYVDFFVKAENTYRATTTDIKRVTVDHLDDVSGLRINLDTSDKLSGAVGFSAKDFSNAASTLTASVDGTPVALTPSLENGAFFTFSYRGVDSYFQNALTTGDTVIRHFSKSSEIPADSSMAILVDESLFTYNDDGSATIELTIRTGTYGSPWESDTAANNDDFYIDNMALSLTDGTVIAPSSVKSDTGADIDTSTEIKVGDSSGYNLWVTMIFDIPAGSADAFSGTIDTTLLSDGEHTLSVNSSSGLSESVTFTTDNTPEIPEPEVEQDLNLGLTVNASAYPATAQAEVPEGSSEVKLYEARELNNIKVYTGTGDSTSNAAAAESAVSVSSDDGQIPYEIFEIDTDGADSGKLRVDVEAASSDGKDVNLYVKDIASGEWKLLDTDYENGVASAVFDLTGNVENGVATVLAQARGTEYSPYTEAQATEDTVKNDYSWDGTGIPEQYDFALAWITDTQYYSEQYMDNFDKMTDWIVGEKDNLGIEYVIHTGDIVDEFNEEYQFQNASEQLSKFEEAGLPYGVLGGNHDVAHGNAVYDLYYKYFGEWRYNSNPWYGGSYDNNKGHYDLVTVDGEELIFIYMSWDAFDNEIKWMNEILAEYSDRTAFICMHPGINAKAVPDYFSERIMNEVCSVNKNVLAVLNGHYHGSSLNFVGFDDNGDGEDDRVVYRICTDYQSAAGGGSGYVKMIYFDLANDRIYLNSYSPVLDDFNYYDREKLDSYGAGTVEYDIDITELSYDFDRTGKTLNVSGMTANLLTDNEIASAAANDASAIELPTNAGETASIYSVAYDNNNDIYNYSPVVTYTVESGAVSGDVEAPETAGVNETFSIDITTGADVIGFLLQNESGKKITIKSITSEVNEEGNIEWTIETAIGTAGSRELSLIPVSATSGAYGAIPIAIEIVDNYEPYSVIAAGFAQNAALVNAPVELDVLTGPGSSIIKVQSETGRNMGKTLVSRTANTDGSIAWTFEMSIGTAGQRVFDVYVSHDGALSEPVQADIIIV